MGAERHNPEVRSAAPAWLDLLHLEADGALSEGQRATLRALEAREGEAVQRQRRRLTAGAAALTVSPPLPRSVAADVAREVGLAARLGATPALPSSVAAAVAADIRLAAQLTPVTAPRSVAAQVARDVQLHAALGVSLPPAASVAAPVAERVAWNARLQPGPLPRPSVAALVAARVTAEAAGAADGTDPQTVRPAVTPLPPLNAVGAPPRHNPAPLILVVSLLLSLTLLGVVTVWPNLAAGAVVVQTLLAQVSPVAGAGLALLLVTSALVSARPTPVTQRLGAGAFALSAALTLPALYGLAGNGVTFGDVQVGGRVNGNVITVGGNVHLNSGADVRGEVITLLGDVYRAPDAQVTGRVNALLGHAPGDREALATAPPRGLAAVTASAFRPVLGWLGSAAWPQVFVTLTGGALLLLFVSGLAPVLARRQRHAPVRTLALGILALAVLLGPAGGLALAGLLGPALIALALTAVLLALGLSVSAYDVGRAVALRARLPVPDAVGGMLGLCAVAASLSVPPLAFALALVGGAWGAGTLLLARGQAPEELPDAA
ncbi:polymer-forming cytoskeletal protein [Deinococcus sp. ME38]|uniref:polymer-forming cytoskeletal protein n=1 Tax=Deinococcus sp. ME38 TaxID=3400344 RepID=UPI003B5937D4